MALIKFIGNVFKKIAKLFGRIGKKKTHTDRAPGERRIGIYGPSNVGKSVFFTMLYKACRQDREFNLSPDDPNTGKQLVTNLNTLRGGEWLPGTVEESELNFKASLRGGSQFPFSTRDYKGETVDLEQEGSAKQILIDYFQDCDAILFLISPEMIADPRKCEREIMSFTAMINQVTEQGGKGLRIPIGLMITKSDEIEGFENDSQVCLISRKAEYLKAKDFGEFVDGMCGQYHIARNIVFQEEVRETLKRLSLFFDFLMTLSMEFQVFFVSSVGHVRKVEESPGKVVSRPPEDPEGIGVKTPFLWVIDTIRQREKIAAFNGLRRFVFRVALVILAFYSIFYGWQLMHHRNRLTDLVDRDESPTQIETDLAGESGRWIVKRFSFFGLPWTKASDVPAKTENLTARYQAHRFLDEELSRVEGATAIRQLSESYKSDSWMREHPWYARLTATQSRMVDDAVWARVAWHNLQVANRIQELEAQYASGEQAATDEAVGRCTDILKEFVEPQQGLDEHRRMVARYTRVCDRIGRSGSERKLLESWEAILQKLNDVSVTTLPPSGDIESLRQEVQAFGEGAGNASSAELRDKAQIAREMDKQLRNMHSAIQQMADPDAWLRELRNIQRNSVGDLVPLRTWASHRISDQVSGKNRQLLANLGEEIRAIVDDPPQYPRLLSIDLQGRLEQAKLHGEKAAALQRYFDNLKILRTQGTELTLTVTAVPENFVVVYWDQENERGGQSQATARYPINVQWIASKPVRVGILKRGAASATACWSRSLPIQDIRNQPLVINCPGSGGATTQVDFQGLDRVLREMLAEPLRQAFAP